MIMQTLHKFLSLIPKAPLVIQGFKHLDTPDGVVMQECSNAQAELFSLCTLRDGIKEAWLDFSSYEEAEAAMAYTGI